MMIEFILEINASEVDSFKNVSIKVSTKFSTKGYVLPSANLLSYQNICGLLQKSNRCYNIK